MKSKQPHQIPNIWLKHITFIKITSNNSETKWNVIKWKWMSLYVIHTIFIIFLFYFVFVLGVFFFFVGQLLLSFRYRYMNDAVHLVYCGILNGTNIFAEYEILFTFELENETLKDFNHAKISIKRYEMRTFKRGQRKNKKRKKRIEHWKYYV